MHWTASSRVRSAALAVALMVVTPPPALAQDGNDPRAETRPQPVVIEVSRDSFDWQDAAVGATGMVAAVAIGFGLVLVVRRPGPPPRKGKR